MNDIKELIREEAEKGNVVLNTIEGLATINIDALINQPTDGLLYDLNRTPEGIMTFINDPKWINDYAVYLVIKRLKEMCQEKYDEGFKHGSENDPLNDGKF